MVKKADGAKGTKAVKAAKKGAKPAAAPKGGKKPLAKPVPKKPAAKAAAPKKKAVKRAPKAQEAKASAFPGERGRRLPAAKKPEAKATTKPAPRGRKAAAAPEDLEVQGVPEPKLAGASPAAAAPVSELEASLRDQVLPAMAEGLPFYVGRGALMPADLRFQLNSRATKMGNENPYAASLQSERLALMDEAEHIAKREGIPFMNTKELPRHLAAVDGYKDEPAVRFMRFHQAVPMPRGEAWQAAPTMRDHELGVGLLLPLGNGELEPEDFIVCQQVTQRLVLGRPVTVVGVLRPRWSSRKESAKTVANEVLMLEAYDETGRLLYRNGMLTVAQARAEMEAARGRAASLAQRPRSQSSASAHFVAAPGPGESVLGRQIEEARARHQAQVPAESEEAAAAAAPSPRKPRRSRAEQAAEAAPAAVSEPVRPVVATAPANLRGHLLGAEGKALLSGGFSGAAAAPAAVLPPAPPSAMATLPEGAGASELSRRLGQSNEVIRLRVQTYIQERGASGASVGEILAFLGVPSGDPNLKSIRNFLGVRVLDPLQEGGLIRLSGERRWARYFTV